MTSSATAIEIIVPSDYWVSADARVGLAPGVRAHGERLVVTERDHVVLNAVGRRLVEGMDQEEVAVAALEARVRHHYDLSSSRAERDVRAFIDDLQARGLVSVRQPAGRELLHRAGGPLRLLATMWRGAFPERHRYPERRLQPGAAQVVRACARAMLPTAVVVAVGTVLFGLLHLWRRGAGIDDVAPFVPLFTAIALCLGGYLAASFLTSLAHELAHLGAARLLGVRVRSVFVRFSLAGVTHARTSPGRQALIAAAGGLAGSASAAALIILLLLTPLESAAMMDPLAVDVVVIVAGLVLMGLHLSSLTPLTGEGRRLWSATARSLRTS